MFKERLSLTLSILLIMVAVLGGGYLIITASETYHWQEHIRSFLKQQIPGYVIMAMLVFLVLYALFLLVIGIIQLIHWLFLEPYRQHKQKQRKNEL